MAVSIWETVGLVWFVVAFITTVGLCVLFRGAATHDPATLDPATSVSRRPAAQPGRGEQSRRAEQLVCR